MHREECEQEKVLCVCPGCDACLLRKGMDTHVEATHMRSAAKQLQILWRADAERTAVSNSEQRLAAASPTSWVFNWRADGWGGGYFMSEKHRCGNGVARACTLDYSSNPTLSHFTGVQIEGRANCRLHATLFILDKHDKILREVYEVGTAAAPFEFTDPQCWGQNFTPTAEEKVQSVRADGSIRLQDGGWRGVVVWLR